MTSDDFDTWRVVNRDGQLVDSIIAVVNICGFYVFFYYSKIYSPSKKVSHRNFFKMSEAVSHDLYIVEVCRCNHRLRGTREPLRQLFIKIKNGLVSSRDLYNIYWGAKPLQSPMCSPHPPVKVKSMPLG